MRTAEAAVASYGGCYSFTTHDVNCEANSSSCEDLYWMTPSGLAGYGISCTLDDIETGSCYDAMDTHVATCAWSEEDCPHDSFYWIDPGYEFGDDTVCTGYHNRDKHPAHYSVCQSADGTSNVCSFGSMDCLADETYYDPWEVVEGLGLQCYCTDVHTGACYDTTTDATTCTYSKESCEDGEVWISARDAEDTYDLGCRACAAEPTPAPTPADFCHDFASLDDDVMSEVQHIGCEGYYTTDVGCPIAVDGSYWYDDDATCADFCESFSVDAVCVGAHEYDDNQCGSDLVQDLECDDVIIDSDVSNIWHVTCSCSTDTSAVEADDNADCIDDDDWMYKSSSKDCGWVAKKAHARCHKKGADGTTALSSCTTACSSCECEDDSSWYQKKKPSRDCDYVAKKPSGRCLKEGEDGTFAYESCPMSCGMCGCQDSAVWQHNGKSSRDCDWVAKKPDSRCKKEDLVGVKAKNACLVACQTCD